MLFLRKWKNISTRKLLSNVEVITKNSRKGINFPIESSQVRKNTFQAKLINKLFRKQKILVINLIQVEAIMVSKVHWFHSKIQLQSIKNQFKWNAKLIYAI